VSLMAPRRSRTEAGPSLGAQEQLAPAHAVGDGGCLLYTPALSISYLTQDCMPILIHRFACEQRRARLLLPQIGRAG
jgi:hypothetical protein